MKKKLEADKSEEEFLVEKVLVKRTKGGKVVLIVERIAQCIIIRKCVDFHQNATNKIANETDHVNVGPGK